MLYDKAVVIKFIEEALVDIGIEASSDMVNKTVLLLCVLEQDFIKLFNKYQYLNGVVLELDVEKILSDRAYLDFEYKNRDNHYIKMLSEQKATIREFSNDLVNKSLMELFSFEQIEESDNIPIIDMKKIHIKP